MEKLFATFSKKYLQKTDQVAGQYVLVCHFVSILVLVDLIL